MSFLNLHSIFSDYSNKIYCKYKCWPFSNIQVTYTECNALNKSKQTNQHRLCRRMLNMKDKIIGFRSPTCWGVGVHADMYRYISCDHNKILMCIALFLVLPPFHELNLFNKYECFQSPSPGPSKELQVPSCPTSHICCGWPPAPSSSKDQQGKLCSSRQLSSALEQHVNHVIIQPVTDIQHWRFKLM